MGGSEAYSSMHSLIEISIFDMCALVPVGVFGVHKWTCVHVMYALLEGVL